MSKSPSLWVALLLALASLAVLKVGALQMCGTGSCQALPLDATILSTLHAMRSPALDSFFTIVTWAGSIYLLLPVAIGCALFDKHATSYLHRWFVPVALCGIWLVVQSAKVLVARPRPALFDALITMPADASYPSAHAAQITAFACAWLLRPGYRAGVPVICMLLVAVLTVALSRPYLQVHYPSDVMYAMAASALWVAALWSLRVTAKNNP